MDPDESKQIKTSKFTLQHNYNTKIKESQYIIACLFEVFRYGIQDESRGNEVHLEATQTVQADTGRLPGGS
jgi:hypothetical protein